MASSSPFILSGIITNHPVLMSLLYLDEHIAEPNALISPRLLECRITMPIHHIAAMLPPAWGHNVGYIHLVMQLLNADPTLVITITQHNLMSNKTEQELSKCTYDKTRLRIWNVGEKDIVSGPGAFKASFQQLAVAWTDVIRQLAEGSDGWPKPHTIHLDFICGGFVIDETKRVMGPECKTLLWSCCIAVSIFTLLTEYDFTSITEEIYADATRRGSRAFDEILQQVALAWNGRDKLTGMVIKNPGIPDMYDHERFAYGSGHPTGISKSFAAAQKLGKSVDGYIIASSECFEPVGVPYWREYYRKQGKELFPVGLQTHESLYLEGTREEVTNDVVRSFLDNSVRKHGPHSVLYISFGSMFFPTATPHLVEALISTLLELEQPFPFILALGGIMASLPQQLIERVNASASDTGLICDFWVEQPAILQSGAVGWFLTHGGVNSVTECLTQAIPMIIWPVGAEQPVNAACLSTGPNATAIELLQVRTGPQLGPALRGGPPITGTVEDASNEFREAFSDARGAKGKMLRANAVRMSKAIREARAGEVTAEILRLATF